MSPWLLLSAILAGSALASDKTSTRRSERSFFDEGCPRITPINRSLRDVYCDQPVFVNIVPKTCESELLDNICYTFFPLPDDPSTFQIYVSRVYCDGSNDIISFIGTDFGIGIHRVANPFLTVAYSYFGYAGCDTYLTNVCVKYGEDGRYDNPYFEGLSSNCRALGLSCLRKVEEIMEDNGLPDVQFYVLPMKLPNRCVTQQLCLQPPRNEFYKAVGLPGPIGFY